MWKHWEECKYPTLSFHRQSALWCHGTATHLLGLPLLDAAGEVDTDAAGAEVSAADVAGDRRHGDRCNR